MYTTDYGGALLLPFQNQSLYVGEALNQFPWLRNISDLRDHVIN
ncbi:unnamed protein product [Arabidopsis halleri]